VANTLFHRLRRRLKHQARHSDTVFHPVVNYAIVALLITATVVLVIYTVSVK
jgi:hypothetical protein